MELNLEDIDKSLCEPVFASWVYVSSLATRTYTKSPLLRRWCEIRQTRLGMWVLDFYRLPTDVEPTKRVHLSVASVVVSRSSKLTSAQAARIPDADERHVAFYLSFPPGGPRAGVESRKSYNADFPLGFIMVASRETCDRWEELLVAKCQRFVLRDNKRAKIGRWLNRAWHKVQGKLVSDQFDSSKVVCEENFFTITNVCGEKRASLDELRLSDSEESSFKTVASSDGDDSPRVLVPVRSGGVVHNDGVFSSLEGMFAEKSDTVRHSTRISESELNSMVEFVNGTRRFSESIPPEWSLCCEGEFFDCFRSIDETTGIVKTRTWAQFPGIPAQCLFYILYDNETRRKWDHHYCRFESEWIDPTDANLDILDACVAAPFGCANREFLEWRRRKISHTVNDPFVIYLRSWDEPDGRPAARGAVRAEVWLSGYLIFPTKEGSEVLVFTQIDIKGLIPKYIVNALSSSAPKKWVKGVGIAALAEMKARNLEFENAQKMSHNQLNHMYALDAHE